MPDPAARATPEPIVHPGDIIQITEPTAHWFLALLVVDEVKGWGCMAHALVPHNDGPTQQAFQRVARGTFAVVGAVALIDPDTHKARLASIETAETAAKEKE